MGTRREVNDRFPSISQHSDLCARSQTACHPLIHFVEQCSQRHTSLRLSSFRGRVRISSKFQSQQCIQCFHPAHTLIVYFDTFWRTLISSILQLNCLQIVNVLLVKFDLKIGYRDSGHSGNYGGTAEFPSALAPRTCFEDFTDSLQNFKNLPLDN